MTPKELCVVLKTVSPALAGRGVALPILDHFVFDGETVLAYDGVVALKADCRLPIVGAVAGGPLLGVVGCSAAKGVVVVPVDAGEVVVKLGRAKLRLAVLPLEEHPFRTPGSPGDVITLDERFVSGLRLVLRSAEVNNEAVIRSGVTCRVTKNRAWLYATDSATVARVGVPVYSPGLLGRSFIMHKRFCSLLLSVGAKSLFLGADGSLVGDGGSAIVYGAALAGADPDMYDGLFTKAASGVADLPVAKALGGCLRRAVAINEDETEFSYANGELCLYSQGQGGEIRDRVTMDLGPEPVTVITCAEYLLRYLDVMQRMGISRRCFVLRGGDLEVLVATKG
jgi:hypothetical protein